MTTVLVDGDIVEDIGHIWIDANGYPKYSIGNQQDDLVHRYVAAKTLGRPLVGREQVHHVNENKLDARRSNLVICPNDAYHALLHARTDSLDDGFSPDTHGYCSDCKTYHVKEDFPKSKNRWNGIHNVCKEKQNSRRRKI